MHSEASRTRLAAIAALLAGTLVSAQSRTPPATIVAPDAIERWLAAVGAHTPGVVDDAARTVATWPDGQLRALSNELLRAANLVNSRPIQQTLGEWAVRQFRITTKADAQRLFKRGAILHADIAMFASDLAGRDRGPARGPGTAVIVRDGEAVGIESQPVHWSLGRTLIHGVQPREIGVAPSRIPTRPVDEFARHWFRATTAFLAHHLILAEVHPHTQQALDSIGGDPVLLLLAGAMHEQLASPGIQSAVRSAALPDGITAAVGSEGNELDLARQLYERAVRTDGSIAETHIRLGRVLGRRGDHADAIRALKRGEELAVEARWKYFAALFLGQEEEQLKRHADARAAYTRAAELYPRAQSPRLAMSRLAVELGEHKAAASAAGALLSLDGDPAARHDPWWTYGIRASTDVARMLTEYYAVAKAVR